MAQQINHLAKRTNHYSLISSQLSSTRPIHWFSDPSFRVIPRDATAEDIRVYHLHINPDFIQQDINCALPVKRLVEFCDHPQIA
jgi:hypothetical protein